MYREMSNNDLTWQIHLSMVCLHNLFIPPIRKYALNMLNQPLRSVAQLLIGLRDYQIRERRPKKCWCHLPSHNAPGPEIITLRKHAHAINRDFLALKIENFQLQIFDIFLILFSKHRLWVHVRTASPRRF